jgi:hypothetical protein
MRVWRDEPPTVTDTGSMAANDSLKRLGGGRWETRDGRFAIEPQSGTWVVVDNTQTDELGLPLVRGPFGSLTAAREAIEGIRTSGPAQSPLADRLKEAKAGQRRRPTAPASGADGRATTKGAKTGAMASAEAAPEAPAEPRWLRDLDPSDRRRARELIEKLEKLDIEDAEELARSEIARNQPALARLAIERAIQAGIARSRSPAGAARAAIEAILSGRDKELGARWRLVDDRGRMIDSLDIRD